MEITEDIIVGSIIKQLKDHFGNSYKNAICFDKS